MTGIGLPRLLVLTDRHQARGPLVDVVRAAVRAGARAVLVREKDLPRPERCALVAALAPSLHEAGGVVLSAGDELLPGADGVHQPAARQAAGYKAAGRKAAGRGTFLTGRSCHDVDELQAAADDGVDYVTVSPVFATRSKPGYGPVLGVDGLASLVASTTLPVYALGGVDASATAAACRDAGAHGVAVMGAVMRDRRPGLVVSELLEAVEEPCS